MQVHPEVADALASGAPVVALESTIISHGLPRPDNLRIAREIEDAVRAGGAVPATDRDRRRASRGSASTTRRSAASPSDPAVVKVSVRDLATVAARGGMGATTVASTAHLAARAGIAVFATGGLGGVHRGAVDTWDESADLTTLSRTPVLVVCAGVKSILDVAATLERLETLNIGVLGYRTDRFPGFYLRDSGHPLDWRVDSPAEVAAVLRARRELGTDGYGARARQPGRPRRRTRPRRARRRADARARGSRRRAVCAARTSRRSCSTASTARPHGASLATNVALVPQQRAAGRPGRRAVVSTTRTRVVCVGDVMVDVHARLPGELAVGSDTPADITFTGGGSAANTAAWLVAAGRPAMFVGRVGDDALGSRATRELQAAGVDVRADVDGELPTGTCIVLVDPGWRADDDPVGGRQRSRRRTHSARTT